MKNDVKGEDVDISVHCDIYVFEWLMQHMKGNNPNLEISNVVSIVISSQFLQMNELVDECVSFMAKNLSQIIELPLDLSCLNDQLLKKLNHCLSDQDLFNVNDPNDKVFIKLYFVLFRLFLLCFACVFC